MKLSDIIGSASRPREIELLPSVSSHGTLARKALNEIICERPEYADEVYLLSIFPLLMWSSENERRKVCPERDSPAYEMFIRNRRACCEIFRITGEIAGLYRDALSAFPGSGGDCLRAVHGNSPDVSRFVFVSHYKPAVISLCGRVKNKTDERLTELFSILDDTGSEELLVLHDIDTVFRLNAAGRGIGREEYEAVREYLLFTADALGTFSLNGEEMRDVLSLHINGIPETEIADALGRSRTYIRKVIKEARNASGIAMWGLSSKNIVSWIRKEEQW